MNKDNCITLWNSDGDICTVLEIGFTPQQFAQLIPPYLDSRSPNAKISKNYRSTSLATINPFNQGSVNKTTKLEDRQNLYNKRSYNKQPACSSRKNASQRDSNNKISINKGQANTKNKVNPKILKNKCADLLTTDAKNQTSITSRNKIRKDSSFKQDKSIPPKTAQADVYAKIVDCHVHKQHKDLEKTLKVCKTVTAPAYKKNFKPDKYCSIKELKSGLGIDVATSNLQKVGKASIVSGHTKKNEVRVEDQTIIKPKKK